MRNKKMFTQIKLCSAKWKIAATFVIFFIISVCYLLHQPDGRECFENHGFFQRNLLPDILKGPNLPQPGKTIFFHETSCNDGVIKLNARQACAIESAAKMNPDWSIFVLFASPVGFTNTTKLPIIDALLSYPNIYLRNVNLWSYAKNTPIEDWIEDGKLFQSKYMNSHASDYLRYLSLWKWGGTYLDLDVVVKTSFNNLEPNYAGAESDNFVAAGVLNFDHNGVGRNIAEMCLREFALNFNGNDWGGNGPGVITRVLNKVCSTKTPLYMTRKRCHGFNVYPVESFYAIGWINWNHFFKVEYLNSTMAATKNSFVVHVWNKHSIKERLRVGEKVAYGIYADKYCTKVYRSGDEYF